MRLILIDRLPQRSNFHPLTFCRPTWELRCGMTTLGEKLRPPRPARSGVACFVPPYLADVVSRQTAWPVNDPASLRDDDLLVAAGRVKAAGLALVAGGPSRVALDAGGEVLLARITRDDLAKLPADSIQSLLAAAKQSLPVAAGGVVPAWNYPWELVLANAEQLIEDFRAAGKQRDRGQGRAALGDPRQPRRPLRRPRRRRSIPWPCWTPRPGRSTIDEGAEIQPFTRIEGPCYVGKQSILLGAKCRRGNTIGPMCRVGGEVEQSILQGYINKYHDGFLGHAYVGQWVNLGALTDQQRLAQRLRPGQGRAGRPHGDRHRLEQSGRPDRRPYEDVHRHALEHRRLRGGDGPTGHARRVAAEVHSLVRLVLKGAVSEGPGKRRLYETARLAMAPRHPLDRGRRGAVG